MSIRFVVNEYCGNCNEYEPEVEREQIAYRDDLAFLPKTEYMSETTIRCKHSQRCGSMLEYLEREKNKETKDDSER